MVKEWQKCCNIKEKCLKSVEKFRENEFIEKLDTFLKSESTNAGKIVELQIMKQGEIAKVHMCILISSLPIEYTVGVILATILECSLVE